MSELNTKNPPKIIGYHKFVKHSSKKFHGVAIYVSNQYQGKVQGVPDDSEGKFVHLIMKETVPQLHIIAVYLDGEKGDQDKTSRVWHYLENKVQCIMETGQEL